MIKPSKILTSGEKATNTKYQSNQLTACSPADKLLIGLLESVHLPLQVNDLFLHLRNASLLGARHLELILQRQHAVLLLLQLHVESLHLHQDLVVVVTQDSHVLGEERQRKETRINILQHTYNN